MFCHSDFVKSVGLMNEEYFLYYEELDWSLRGRKKGWKAFICTEATVYHRQGATTQTGSQRESDDKNLAAEKFKYSSFLKFYKNYYPSLLLIAYARLILMGIKKYMTGAFREGNLIFRVVMGR